MDPRPSWADERALFSQYCSEAWCGCASPCQSCPLSSHQDRRPPISLNPTISLSTFRFPSPPIHLSPPPHLTPLHLTFEVHGRHVNLERSPTRAQLLFDDPTSPPTLILCSTTQPHSLLAISSLLFDVVFSPTRKPPCIALVTFSLCTYFFLIIMSLPNQNAPRMRRHKRRINDDGSELAHAVRSFVDQHVDESSPLLARQADSFNPVGPGRGVNAPPMGGNGGATDPTDTTSDTRDASPTSTRGSANGNGNGNGNGNARPTTTSSTSTPVRNLFPTTTATSSSTNFLDGILHDLTADSSSTSTSSSTSSTPSSTSTSSSSTTTSSSSSTRSSSTSSSTSSVSVPPSETQTRTATSDRNNADGTSTTHNNNNNNDNASSVGFPICCPLNPCHPLVSLLRPFTCPLCLVRLSLSFHSDALRRKDCTMPFMARFSMSLLHLVSLSLLLSARILSHDQPAASSRPPSPQDLEPPPPIHPSTRSNPRRTHLSSFYLLRLSIALLTF